MTRARARAILAVVALAVSVTFAVQRIRERGSIIDTERLPTEHAIGHGVPLRSESRPEGVPEFTDHYRSQVPPCDPG